MTSKQQQGASLSRRGFMQASALGAAALTLGAQAAHGQDVEPLRVGLVGCGKRGTGAARNCVESSPAVHIAALGDIFPDQLQRCRDELAPSLGDNYTANDDTCFTGWDAFEKVIAADVDLVILATPPAFRPQHLAACIDAGKHVFMEKPVAVDPVGVRSILASAEKATEKGLGIVAGNQRRHQAPYVELIKRIHNGAIGEVVSAACYWIGDYEYYPPVFKQDSWSDMEWQLRNWNYFTWLSGDHIVEQHVHNIDIMNWVFQGPPKKAIGMGGRQQRTGPEFGHIYDHFAVEFEYDRDIRVSSLCRQMKNTVNRVAEHVVGTKGTCNPAKSITGENRYVFDGEQISPYVQEHKDLIASIRAGKPLNEARAIAESTMAAIMGRLAAYTGQEVTWKFVMEESTLDLSPPAYEFGPLTVPPVAMPGETELV